MKMIKVKKMINVMEANKMWKEAKASRTRTWNKKMK